MNTLIVVHLESLLLDKRVHTSEEIAESKDLLERIAQRIDISIRQGDSVYYLEGKGYTQCQYTVFQMIKEYLSSMVYIPWKRGGIWKQALVTKELLLDERQDTAKQDTEQDVEVVQQETISVCGVAYTYCVEAVYNALVGQGSEIHSKSQFEKVAREYLRWPNDKFERIFNQKLNAEILKELTDKIV